MNSTIEPVVNQEIPVDNIQPTEIVSNIATEPVVEPSVMEQNVNSDIIMPTIEPQIPSVEVPTVSIEPEVQTIVPVSENVVEPVKTQEIEEIL